MPEPIESQSFLLPSDLKKDLAIRLKQQENLKSIEILFKGDALENAQGFARELLSLRKQGVRISHEVSIRLDFPGQVSRDRVLKLVERLPKSKNGSIKVRVDTQSQRGIDADPS